MYLAVTHLGISATEIVRIANLSPPNALKALAIEEESDGRIEVASLVSHGKKI